MSNADDTADAQEARRWERAMGSLKATALQIKRDRDRYEAALRKITEWEGRVTGANHMLKTLQAIAKEALAP